MKLGWHFRIGAEQGKSRYSTAYVTIVGENSDGAVERLYMSAEEARIVARKLKLAADFLDPKTKRSRS